MEKSITDWFFTPEKLRKLNLKMKLTYLFLLVSLFKIQAGTYSQNTRVSLHMNNVSVTEVFNAIEKQSDFRFLFNHQKIDVQKKVSVNVEKVKISSILDHLFSNSPIAYKVKNKLIILKFDKSKQLTVTEAPSPQQKVQGIVYDNQGLPLVGATIMEKGTQNGTQTDFDGKFSLDVTTQNPVLTFSYVGFRTQEIPVGNQTNISITMEEEVAAIDEVVVVGFASQKRENITGAVSSVKMDEVLADRPVTNGASAIQGTMPGLQVLNGSGRPGTFEDIQIRGLESINGGSPLILVNNVPMSINNINPKDIESITVLKDAAASSIYGSRAAFGVVLITTKKGVKNQAPIVNYSSTISFDNPTELPKKASVYDFVNALNDWGVVGYWTDQDIPTWVQVLEEYKNNPSAYPSGQAEVNGIIYPLKETDIIDDFYGDLGITQIHNLSISGGTDKSTYRLAAGFTDQDGIIVTDNDSFKRYTINADYGVELSEKVSYQANINYLKSLTKDPVGDYYRAITYPVYAPVGNHEMPDGTLIPYNTPGNLERLNVPRKTERDNLRFFNKIEYNPIESLSIVGEYTYGYSTYQRTDVNVEPQTVDAQRYTLNTVSPDNTFYRIENGNTRYNGINLYSTFKKSYNNHNISLLAGFNHENNKSESNWTRKTNLIDPSLPSISQATGTLTADDSFGEWSVMGVFGRLNYDYKNKYFIELNGRYDGSSRFPKNNRWGFFPSASLGWNIAKEEFWEPIRNTISLFKFRASLGEIGNQDIRFPDGSVNLYPAVPGLSAGNSGWIDPNTGIRYVTLAPPQLVSSNFTWETVQTLNFGLDFALFDNKLNGSFDLFTRKTKDMLTQGAELPSNLGTSAPLANAADLETKGWGLELNWKDQIKDFSYYFNVNISDNQSEITKFDNEEGLLGQHYIGKKWGEIWGYVTDGYYSVDDFEEGTLDNDLQNGTLKEGVVRVEGVNPNPGDIKYKDLNGDGIINDGNNTLYTELDENGNPIVDTNGYIQTGTGDRKVIGNNTRRYQYGIRTGASYKNFDVSFFIQGVGKRDRWISNDVVWPYNGEFSIVYDHQLDYWTPENSDAYYPRNYPRGAGNYGYSRRVQTKYLADGSYIRLKNITLGYSLPKAYLENSFLNSVRLYVSGENLLNHDHLPDGLNTELDNLGQGATYPYLKQYAFGLNVSF
ncbi:TonB-dependent receptor [Zhouia spongiae]|uniref:TonB-dependent receptor n=1 Tax=Zhouia spongiae TaxID=2202721 RepID=A0ABY3YL84_9FLAO|nr:TonB-dependent receptor [Zhouia spongiae]UNY97923.1 TonB-dependent receptor [Zhouia spongiae]